MKWFTLAAEQGHADAQLNLGRMYYKGQGVPQDEKTAGKWITLAAEQGHVSAQAILSTMYTSGRGVIGDYVYAHMWGSIAVSRGLPAEIHSLIMTLMPVVAKEMTPAQIEKAEKLASECIAKQYKGCQSTTTESATVATESPSTALSEARSLAEQGDADAQFNLGEMYYYGQGVPQNDKTALKWYTLAAEQGYANAQS